MHVHIDIPVPKLLSISHDYKKTYIRVMGLSTPREVSYVFISVYMIWIYLCIYTYIYIYISVYMYNMDLSVYTVTIIRKLIFELWVYLNPERYICFYIHIYIHLYVYVLLYMHRLTNYTYV
jgi:hypothetical protein